MRWLCAFWLVLGAFLCGAMVVRPAAGAPQVRAARHSGAFSVTLPASSTRMGLVAAFEPKSSKLTLRSLDPSATAPHELQLPELPSGSARSELVPLAGGEHALVLRFGGAKAYVLVLLGPTLGGDPSAPGASSLADAIVLKGMLDPNAEGEASLTAQAGPDGQRLILSEADGPSLCGHGRRLTRHLDAKRGRFVRVAVPLLGAEQRRKAARLSAVPAPPTSGERVLYLGALPSPFETGAVEAEPLVDARFAEAALPYEVADLSALVALGARTLVVRVKEDVPAEASWDLWLWTETGVVEVDTSAVRGTPAFAVDLPPSLTTGCLGLTVGPRAPYVEVTGRLAAVESPVSPGQALAGTGGDQALRELALVRPSVLPELASSLASLPPAARTRAEALARLAEPADAEPFWIRQWLDGSEGERTRAQARLGSAADGGRGAFGRALGTAAPKDELRLARALASLSPAAALGPIASRLGQRSPARRLELRKVLAEFGRDAEFASEVERLLIAADVPRVQKVEVLRAVAPLTPHLAAGPRQEVLRLLESASFREAYVLVPVALELAALVPAAEQVLVEWVSGKRLAIPSLERAALRTQVLDLAREHGRPSGKLAAEAAKLLEDPFPRVRARAATYLELSQSGAASALLRERLRRDEWPAVREASLGALAHLRTQPAQAEEAEAAMTRALAKDPVLSVRARAARELDELPRPTTISALRRALAKDESAAVRAEAARSLGELCDHGSTAALTDAARGLTRGAHDEADVRLGLYAVTALARLDPKDLDERLAPLTAESVPGPLRARVESAIARDRGGCATSKKR